MPRYLPVITLFCLFLCLPPDLCAQTVTSSTLLDAREGYARSTTGGLNGQVYVVTSRSDYTKGATPIPGTLRYGVEHLTGKRWVVFDPSIFVSTLSDGRRAAFFNFDRPLDVTRGNLTIDGRAGSDNGAGRVVILKRTYDWANYEGYFDGSFNRCRVKRDSNGRPLEAFGGNIFITNAKNVILSHLTFRQVRLGTPPSSNLIEDCLGDQVAIRNLYPNDDPHQLTGANSYHKIWINRSQFYVCGAQCISITGPSPAVIALISVTRNEFWAADLSMLVGNISSRQATKDQDGTNWRIRLTVAKNHFRNGGDRMPRFNSSYVHSYNNYYQNWTGSAIDPLDDTRVFVEQNFFSTYLSGNARYSSIRDASYENRQVWVDRNVYYKDAIDRDDDFPAIPRYPEKGYYDSAAAPDILQIYYMNPVSAYTLLDSLGGWQAEASDVY